MARVTSMRAHRTTAPQELHQPAEVRADPAEPWKRVAIGVAIAVISAAIVGIGARVLSLNGEAQP